MCELVFVSLSIRQNRLRQAGASRLKVAQRGLKCSCFTLWSANAGDLPDTKQNVIECIDVAIDGKGRRNRTRSTIRLADQPRQSAIDIPLNRYSILLRLVSNLSRCLPSADIERSNGAAHIRKCRLKDGSNVDIDCSPRRTL
jgi:hypothetical protein